MRKSFVVVIPSFNNAPWCRQNLESVLSQDYPEFRVIYVDDASTDETSALAREAIADSGQAHRVTFHQNDIRRGATANIDRAVRSCGPDEVVVLVDGDDFLAHPRVLSRLNAVYQDPDVWVTWGQFTYFPQGREGFCAPIPSEIVSANAFRDYPFVSSHLRTFYAGLYHRIRVADLQDGDGQFFATAGDVAHMFALMEMAGTRARFVAEILYLYNRENPINDDKVDRTAQLRAEYEIRCKTRYGRLLDLASDAPREVCVRSGVGQSLFEIIGQNADIDDRRKGFRQLRAVLNRLGYTVRETQTLADAGNPHHLLVFDVQPDELEALSAHPTEARTLVLWKDPIAAPNNFDDRYHQPFQRIYTWWNDLVDNVRYFKLHSPSLRPMLTDTVPFEKRKLCALIASRRSSDHPDELYSEEQKVAAYFAEAERDLFDLFGWGWTSALNRSYGGILTARVERLRCYRFCLCYETVRGWNGYVSGKIFDAFAAGCVPVYRGAPDIADSIPRDCFIAREDFGSDAELHAFLRDMSDAKHEDYLNRIRAFLSSDAAIPYSPEHFVRTFVDLLGGRATPRIVRNPAASDKEKTPRAVSGGAAGLAT